MLLLALGFALLAALLAGAIASFSYLFFRVPFWPAFKSGLKSSGLLCLCLFLIVVGVKQLVPQQAARPPAAGVPPAPGSADRQTADVPENGR